MKTLYNSFRGMSLANKVLTLVYVLILAGLPAIIGMGPAQAQSGGVYAHPQAQVAGEVYEAVVVQISFKEVEASPQARMAGAAVGGALGVGLASRSSTQSRFAVNTVGAVLGGLLGERVASSLSAVTAQEIILRLAPTGNQQPRIISVIQPAPFDQVYPGEMIYVTVTRGAWRVLRRQPQETAPLL